MRKAKRVKVSRGHSRTHHKLRTHQSQVKMATIIAQQLSAGYVPLPDPPLRRAGCPRCARTGPAFPSSTAFCHHRTRGQLSPALTLRGVRPG